MIGRKLAIAGVLWLITAVPALAQVTIQAQVLQRDLRIFFLSDFNFTGRGRVSGEVFSVTIMNATGTSQRCRLALSISKDKVGLAEGITQPFSLTPAMVIRITNANLFSQAEQFSLDDYRILDEGEKLRNQVLSLGKLPSGIYRFTFRILADVGVTILSDTYIEIDISNPTSLDLISPGAQADRAAPGVSPTPFPLFRWTSNISRFRLRLAEKLSDVHDAASPAEIIQDRVRFERTLTVDAARAGGLAADGSEYISGSSYLYPAAGAWPLEPGKTYYWQITGLVPSSGADAELPSEIWAFTVQEGPGDLSATAPVLDHVLATLHSMSGEEFAGRFAGGGELDGFMLTGRYYLNGRWISLEQMQAILAKIASGEYKLLDTRVE